MPTTIRVPVEPFTDLYPGTPDATILDAIGMGRGALRIWRDSGGIPLDTADVIAIETGRHPFEIWGDVWWAAQQHHLDRTALTEPWEPDGFVRDDDYRSPPHTCASDGCNCRNLIRWRTTRDWERNVRRIEKRQREAP